MPAAYRRPRVRTTPDPLHTLSKRRFEVVAFADDARKERASRRVDAVSASLAVAADMRRKMSEAVQREAFRRECERRRAAAGSWN